MRSEPAVFTTLMMRGFYIHPYPPVISVTLYRVLSKQCQRFRRRHEKASKACPGLFFFLSDFFCVRCAYIVLFYNTSTTRPRPRPAYKGKPSKETGSLQLRWCVGLYLLFLSLGCISWLRRVCWNSVDISDDDIKSAKTHVQVIFFSVFILCALHSHSFYSSTTRSRAASKEKPLKSPPSRGTEGWYVSQIWFLWKVFYEQPYIRIDISSEDDAKKCCQRQEYQKASYYPVVMTTLQWCW